MGTRADFYIGRGKNAEWLGSIAWDGYPSGIDEPLLLSTSEQEFRQELSLFLKRDDATLPEDGWPWPWEDSETTDYAYALDDGKVYASCFGSPWFDPTDEPEDVEDLEGDLPSFPNMETGQSAPPGTKRSGVILIG